MFSTLSFSSIPINLHFVKGVLWDPRYSRAIHKFDRLTNSGSGVFNPSEREVIINRYIALLRHRQVQRHLRTVLHSEVWDLYTFKLLKTVPVLDKANIAFNGLGDIMYGFPRKYDNVTQTYVIHLSAKKLCR